MKRQRHAPEQILRKLREADLLFGEAQELPEVVKQLDASEATRHHGRSQYGGMEADDVKSSKELAVENDRLKRTVVAQTLRIATLDHVSQGNW